ncbi:Cro/Cl family transcriptional regulator (plasmid) [Azospirillum baldaniorum]|uniref:Transcriptional regulator, XRE family n=1 Tax=Azospirillum baldaniorum TaxID=1064539 RepID=A0A9P1JXS5_9PROT|nr:short-chain fatty acyl-CoA regulator family protein [Azospirillum baldaniorum]AWJ93715.1 Cro/Cl family transcriptional regulator [Azospirillum baldaniorum]CCD01828.1 putative transcriptional regulator, XRE family [Azospirillum baldaniorum]
MAKAFMGVRLQRLREERGLTQTALARILEISPSYLNQLERNQRPLTVPLLLRINAAFGIDVQIFSEDEEARLVADLREALSEAGTGETIAMAEIKALATNMPAVGRALVALHRRGRGLAERLDALASGVVPAGPDSGLPPPMPYEEVRDFFYRHHNHIAALDDAAERLFGEAGLEVGAVDRGLERLLADRHGIRTLVTDDTAMPEGALRQYDGDARTLRIARSLEPGRRAFQMATQLAFHQEPALLLRLVEEGRFSGPQARSLARIGLANYYAGAVVMPYRAFRETAEAVAYDIDLLGQRFCTGFETVCHRLSTLQRPGMPGVPFFFVRVDRAGNMSKRQSATSFHFSRVGGTCPLWNVYEAFSTPGRLLTQLARMPDGRAYLWIARTVVHGRSGYGAPSKSFAVGLGCDIQHAGRLIYSRGLALGDPDAATPIGAGCKVCERPYCPQRAFPPIGRTVTVDESLSRFEPYPVAQPPV